MKVVNVFAILDKLTKELFLDRLIITSAAAYVFSISLELSHLELKIVATIFLTYSTTKLITDPFLRVKAKRLVRNLTSRLKKWYNIYVGSGGLNVSKV